MVFFESTSCCGDAVPRNTCPGLICFPQIPALGGILFVQLAHSSLRHSLHGFLLAFLAGWLEGGVARNPLTLIAMSGTQQGLVTVVRKWWRDTGRKVPAQSGRRQVSTAHFLRFSGFLGDFFQLISCIHCSCSVMIKIMIRWNGHFREMASI